MYLSTIADATTFKNFAYILDANALAIKVFPVPGGPYIKQPCIKIKVTLWWLDSNSLE